MTNNIILDLFDKDFDRTADQMTTLDVQYGRWRVIDDDDLKKELALLDKVSGFYFL